MYKIRYTASELQLKYTVQDAINAATVRLNGIPMCMNIVRQIPRDKKINLEQLNELCDQLVYDSNYYNYTI